jgi:hypothetical protein
MTLGLGRLSDSRVVGYDCNGDGLEASEAPDALEACGAELT